MTQQLYDDLWHYSEQFSRDPLQRSELLTIAYLQEKKLGGRCTPALMKSMMHFRSKELNRRSAFPANEMGKRKLDAWNRPERVYLDRPVSMSGGIVADFLLSEYATPYDHTVVNDFLGALTDEEQNVLDDLNAGFKRKEICTRQSITNVRLNSLHKSHLKGRRHLLRESSPWAQRHPYHNDLCKIECRVVANGGSEAR